MVKQFWRDYPVIPQPSGDLGSRLNAVEEALRRRGFEATVLIGSDAPTLSPAHILRCVEGLYRLENFCFDWRERLIEWGANLRVQLFRLPYGDQGYFVRRHCFEQSGSFKPLSLLEDVEWFRRISRMGRIALLQAPLTTSARRIHERGWMRSILINGSVILLYALGVSPARLAPPFLSRQCHISQMSYANRP